MSFFELRVGQRLNKHGVLLLQYNTGGIEPICAEMKWSATTATDDV